MTLKKILFALLISSTLYAQNTDPYKIIERVKVKYESLIDYVADASIKVDVNFLKVPESKAVVYFKKPDKVKLQSEGFALLPKEGLNFLPAKILEEDITAIFTGRDTLRADSVNILKIIPNSDSSDVVLSKLWIDSKINVITKVETTTKKRGTFSVNLFYGRQKEFGLPDSVILSFNISNVPLPNSMTGEMGSSRKKRNRRKFSGPMVGSVTVRYTNYKINTGLSDELFEDHSEGEK
jgi:outer membrane lipoprotein-sorting protein